MDRLPAGWDDDEYRLDGKPYAWCEPLADGCDCDGSRGRLDLVYCADFGLHEDAGRRVVKSKNIRHQGAIEQLEKIIAEDDQRRRNKERSEARGQSQSGFHLINPDPEGGLRGSPEHLIKIAAGAVKPLAARPPDPDRGSNSVSIRIPSSKESSAQPARSDSRVAILAMRPPPSVWLLSRHQPLWLTQAHDGSYERRRASPRDTISLIGGMALRLSAYFDSCCAVRRLHLDGRDQQRSAHPGSWYPRSNGSKSPNQRPSDVGPRCWDRCGRSANMCVV